MPSPQLQQVIDAIKALSSKASSIEARRPHDHSYGDTAFVRTC